MKTLLISLLLFMSVVGCDNLSPEQELDAKLQGKWILVENFTGCFGSGKVDTNTILFFKNNEIEVTNGDYLQNLKYNTITQSDKTFLVIKGTYPSIITDSIGNTKEIYTDEIFQCNFQNNGILEFIPKDYFKGTDFYYKIKRIN